MVPAITLGIMASNDGLLEIVSPELASSQFLSHNWISASFIRADRLFATIDDPRNLPPRIFAYVCRLSLT